MGARGPLGLIARLELRHARSDLRFLLFAAGTDIDEDRGFLERAYQLYLLAIFAVVLALSWGQVVYLVEGMRDALGQVAGALAMALVALAPAAALAAWSLCALRETPLRLTGPDIAWLARVVPPRALLAVQLVRGVVVTALVGALGAYLLGVLALAPSRLAWAALGAAVMPSARLLATLVGLARSASPRRLRLAVTLASGALAALLAAALLFALPTLVFLAGLALVPAALALDATAAACALLLASRADMAFVVDGNELYAARRSLRFLALVDSGAYREAYRRRRLGRRPRARRTWRFWGGPAAAVSHALASLARDPSALLGILSWGALLVPMGALLVAARVNVGVLLSWYLCATLTLREPCPLARVFREDCRNRLVRAQLPMGTLQLLALDSLPALVVALAASAAVVALAAGALGAGAAVPTVLLAWAMLAALTLSAAFDDPRRARGSGSLRATGFVCGALSLFAVGLAGLLGTLPALACALAVDVLLACALRD